MTYWQTLCILLPLAILVPLVWWFVAEAGRARAERGRYLRARDCAVWADDGKNVLIDRKGNAI